MVPILMLVVTGNFHMLLQGPLLFFSTSQSNQFMD